MGRSVCTAWLAVLTAGSLAALAAPTDDESLLATPAHLAARDDALARLFDRVNALTIQDGRPVRVLLHRLDDADLRFRRILVQQARVVAARTYSDGSVDVDLALEVREILLALEQVRKLVPELSRRLPDAPALRGPGETVFATGLAFRPPATIRLPEPPDATAASANRDDASSATPGWRHLSSDARKLAIEAAKRQALSNLLADVGRIRIDDDATVATLLRRVPGQEQAFAETLGESAVYKIDLDPTGICVAHCDVPADVSARFLAPAVDRSLLPPETHSATGLASPPRLGRLSANVVPRWMDHTLIAEGQCPTDLSNDPAFADHVARINADFVLTQQIDALTWTDGKPVRQLLERLPLNNDDLRTYFGGKRTLRTSRTGTGVTVVVELPLGRLFYLLHNAR